MLNKICQLARHAGSVIMNFYNNSEAFIKISYKTDNTPVTNVDYEVNNIIKKELLLITPNVPILSEEEVCNFDVCRNWNDYWLIDPLDGTKEFMKKNGEFTVNISLIKNGQPILGVIYAPVFNILYAAYNQKAWKETTLGLKKELKVSQKSKFPILIITSRSHPDKELKSYLKKLQNYRLKCLGSSLKFCLIAEGKAHFYPRFSKTNIWDTAAGHAIVTAAGGKIETWKGVQLNYSLSSRSSFLHSGFCASAF